jgi:hypothetical protein
MLRLYQSRCRSRSNARSGSIALVCPSAGDFRFAPDFGHVATLRQPTRWANRRHNSITSRTGVADGNFRIPTGACQDVTGTARSSISARHPKRIAPDSDFILRRRSRPTKLAVSAPRPGLWSRTLP